MYLAALRPGPGGGSLGERTRVLPAGGGRAMDMFPDAERVDAMAYFEPG
jgi:hypothetical protein